MSICHELISRRVCLLFAEQFLTYFAFLPNMLKYDQKENYSFFFVCEMKDILFY